MAAPSSVSTLVFALAIISACGTCVVEEGTCVTDVFDDGGAVSLLQKAVRLSKAKLASEEKRLTGCPDMCAGFADDSGWETTCVQSGGFCDACKECQAGASTTTTTTMASACPDMCEGFASDSGWETTCVQSGGFCDTCPECKKSPAPTTTLAPTTTTTTTTLAPTTTTTTPPPTCPYTQTHSGYCSNWLNGFLTKISGVSTVAACESECAKDSSCAMGYWDKSDTCRLYASMAACGPLVDGGEGAIAFACTEQFPETTTTTTPPPTCPYTQTHSGYCSNWLNGFLTKISGVSTVAACESECAKDSSCAMGYWDKSDTCRLYASMAACGPLVDGGEGAIAFACTEQFPDTCHYTQVFANGYCSNWASGFLAKISGASTVADCESDCEKWPGCTMGYWDASWTCRLYASKAACGAVVPYVGAIVFDCA